MTDDEIEALLSKVSSAPWADNSDNIKRESATILIKCLAEDRALYAYANGGSPIAYDRSARMVVGMHWYNGPQLVCRKEDSTFIAAARELVPQLLKRAQMAEASNEVLRATIKSADEFRQKCEVRAIAAEHKIANAWAELKDWNRDEKASEPAVCIVVLKTFLGVVTEERDAAVKRADGSRVATLLEIATYLSDNGLPALAYEMRVRAGQKDSDFAAAQKQ